MEHMEMKKDFKTAGLAGNTWNNWWLSNHDLELPGKGTHYAVFWLTSRSTGKLAAGRLEVTLGPWTWFGYASDNLKKQAQSQTTTCSCATQHAAWYAQNLHMVGYAPLAMFL